MRYIMGYLILIGVIVFICIAIHDCRPDVVKRREDEFLKTLGHDPNSIEAEMIRTKTKHAQLNEQIKKEELKKETAEIAQKHREQEEQTKQIPTQEAQYVQGSEEQGDFQPINEGQVPVQQQPVVDMGCMEL